QNFTVNDLEVTLNLTSPNNSNLDIQLVSPDNTTIQLVRNHLNGFGQVVTPPAGVTQVGMTGSNLGEITTAGVTFRVGTAFDDNAPRSIADPSFTGPYIAHFTPEVGNLDVAGHTTGVQADDTTKISGTWQLLVTDHNNDGTTAPSL